MQEVRIVDLSDALGKKSPSSIALQQAAYDIRDSLRETSCVLVRDPRVSQSDNDAFLDHMETYFNRDTEEKMADVRPELSYQVREQ